jgi:hypothetical protein
MTELILAVTLSAGISAMCSLLYSVPVGPIEALVAEGRRSGIILRDLRADIDRPIAAILSLNTIANTAGAAALNVFGGGFASSAPEGAGQRVRSPVNPVLPAEPAARRPQGRVQVRPPFQRVATCVPQTHSRK